MSKTLIVLPFFFLFLLLSLPVMAVTIETDNDAYVYQYFPNTNYGTQTGIAIRSYAGNNMRAFVSFDLSAQTDITEATLYVYRIASVNNPSGYNYTAYNTTDGFVEGTITWNNQPDADVAQSTLMMGGTMPDWYTFNVTDAAIAAEGSNLTIVIIDDNESAATQYGWSFVAHEYSAYSDYISYLDLAVNGTSNSSACGNITGFINGTVCYENDANHMVYYYNDGCNINFSICPTNSICSQLTPQMNVTSELVENYVSCEIVTTLGFRVQCFNICFPGRDDPVFSNCVDDGCKHCSINAGNYTGYNIQTWITNQTSVSVPSYTIACIDRDTGRAVQIINNTGQNTTEEELLTTAGNNITLIPPSGLVNASEGCVNTSSVCYDSYCNIVDCPPNSFSSLGAWINQGMGSPYATELISAIIAAGFGMFFFMQSKEKRIEAFAIPFISVLIIFSLPGIEFFPSWMLILVGATDIFLIYRMARS